MKMVNLRNIQSSIPKLINIDLPIKIAYQLNLLMDDIEKHINHLQDFRTTFLNKYGERINDQEIKIKTDKMREFDIGMAELLEEEIDVQPIQLPLSLLFDTNIKFTVLEIESLKKSGFLVDDIQQAAN